MLSGGVMAPSSMDYHQLGRRTPTHHPLPTHHHPSLDWSSDYHTNGWVWPPRPCSKGVTWDSKESLTHSGGLS